MSWKCPKISWSFFGESFASVHHKRRRIVSTKLSALLEGVARGETIQNWKLLLARKRLRCRCSGVRSVRHQRLPFTLGSGCFKVLLFFDTGFTREYVNLTLACFG